MSSELTATDLQRMRDAMVAGARAGEGFAQRLREFLACISDPSVDPLMAARELGLEEWARRAMESGE